MLVSLQTDDDDDDDDDGDDDGDGVDDDDDSKEFPLVRPIHRSLGIDPNHSCPQRLVKYAATLLTVMMKPMIIEYEGDVGEENHGQV